LTTNTDGIPQGPRICLCVMMNHPFPANLPLLRRVYAGRFSELLFLVPFAQTGDADVVTVYRGSYTHAAYITDAMPRLSQVECDHFLFVHDDVLLNPQFDETSFQDLFPLGPDDGFLPWIEAAPEKLGDWEWYYSFLPKLLNPKSLLFGTGIERDTLLRYLPDAETVRAGFERSGAPHTDRVSIAVRAADDTESRGRGAERQPSKVILDGLSAALDHDTPAQQAVDGASESTLRAVTATLAAAAVRDGHGTAADTIDLPFPIAVAGYFTDFYILPRTKLAQFAHYMGVAGAANLFVEIIAPVLLHTVCDRVWTAAALKLDFNGFHRPHRLDAFADPRVMALHPFKFSTLREPAKQDAFMAIVEALRTRAPLTQVMGEAAGIGPVVTDTAFYKGWHPREGWGRWAAVERATVRVAAPGPRGAIKLSLVAPVSAAAPDFTGSVIVNGGPPQAFSMHYPKADATLIVAARGRPIDGAVRVDLVSDTLYCPRDFDPESPDVRSIGVGLRAIDPV